ncbi:hypothetical protein FGG08_001989 [Glutinoglossum americanum]|uniref:Uncharacterized protein n=1 Tax=Glutinoglossum americanum TaxID=1670608 RepID=A0A9P8L244_9PEZI|nr:hypothetical protein FGG08_001989 [Glutinoglossum americanum]
MRLWNLAPELLIQILRFTDPSTFYILTQSVVPFLSDATTASKSLLLYQLGALPGLKHGLEALTTQELFYCFQTRAAKCLCGVDALAGITLFSSGFADFDIRQSLFYKRFNGSDCLCMVHRNEPCVFIFALRPRGGPLRLNKVVDLREEYGLGESCALKIKRIAVSPSGGCWVIHYSYEAVMPKVPTTFVKERLEQRASSRLSFKLAIVDQRGDMYHLALPDILSVPLQPFGLAISDDEHVALCRKSTWLRKGFSEVIIYRGRTNLNTTIRTFRARIKENLLFTHLCEIPTKVIFTSGDFSNLNAGPVPIQDVKFSSDGRQLLLFSSRSPIHYLYLDYLDGDPIEFNRIIVSGFAEGVERKTMHVGMPFYTSHTTQEETTGDGVERVCTDVWLSIGAESNTVSTHAYVVRSTLSQPSIDCDCVRDLDSGRRLYGWDALVLLEDFLRSTSSLGAVTTMSEDSSRLAVADWKSIRIWPLDPQGLIQNEADHYRRTNRLSEFEVLSGIGVIEPFQLPTNGNVIHKLFFASNDILYGVTDHGLTMWDLNNHVGRGSASERATSTSEYPARD